MSSSRLAPTLKDLTDAGWSLLTTTMGLGVAIWVVDGASADGVLPVLLVGVLVAIGDLLLRPALRLLAVAAGAIGALICGVAAQVLILGAALTFVPGVVVDGWVPVIWVLVVAALVMAFGRWLLGVNDSAYVLGDVLRRARSRARRWGAEHDGPPGLLVIQLDGLSRSVLEYAVDAGLAPTMGRWLREGSHRLVPWWACVPSTTPASQAALLHGNGQQLPAFRWWDRHLGRLLVTNRPGDAAEVERRLSDGQGLLADGGVAIGTMFSGDAPTSLLVMSTAGGGKGLGPGPAFLQFFASPFVLFRAAVLSVVEMVKELYQGHRQRVRGVEPRVPRRGAYVLLRGVSNGLLRDLNISLVAEHLQRRAPVIFVDFVDYDEIAHHAGPMRPEALRALEGLDGVIGLLERVVADCGRDYRIVVLSDHGQSLGPTFRQTEGRELVDVLRSLLDMPKEEAVQARDGEAWGPLNTLLTTAFRRGPDKDPVVLGPDRELRADEGVPRVSVIGSGNLGLVWFPELPGRATLEEIVSRWPQLIVGLAARPAIGVVVVETEDRGPVAVGAEGLHLLRDGHVEGTDPLLPYGSRARADLLRAAGLANTGDLLLISSIDPTGQVHAFEELVGSHGGLGGLQNDAMLLHPVDLAIDEGLLEPVDGLRMLVGGEAVHRQLMQWMSALGLRQ